MFRRQPTTLRFDDIGALGDTKPSVMRFVHVFGREEAVVGRDQRQVHAIGKIDQIGLDPVLDLQPVAHQFHIEPAGEQAPKLLCNLLRHRLLPFGEQPADRARGTTGQCDQAVGKAFQITQRDLRRRCRIAFHKGLADQLRQVRVAGFRLDQQSQLVRKVQALADRLAAAIGRRTHAPDADLTAKDRLNARIGHHQRELQRAEQVAGVGDGDSRHVLLLAKLDQLLDLDRPFGERIGGVDAQVDEIGNRHGGLDSGIGRESGTNMPSGAHTSCASLA